jgi:4-hydroxy-3-polyprenylbenzoate decarboxylase
VDRAAYDWSSACDLGPVPAGVTPMEEAALARDMEVFIREAPRSWREILQRYHGQPYRPIYRAFSGLRHRLGRADDAPWYRYTFSDSDFATAPPPKPVLSNHDPRHQPAPHLPPPRVAPGA